MITAVQYKVLRRSGWGVMVALGLYMAGCSPLNEEVVREVDLPAFKRGQDYLRQGRHDQALTAFLKVVENHSLAPESHLYLGQLFLENSKDPVLAIYHFRQFLKFKPGSQQAPLVRDLINTAKKEFARTFPANLFEAELDRIDLMDVIEKKDREILSMKEDLARLKGENKALRARLQAEGVEQPPPASPAQTPPASLQPRVPPLAGSDLPLRRDVSPNQRAPAAFYTVVTGDNLLKISTKVYGSRDRWVTIYEANRDLLDNPNALKIGMKLRIP